MRRSIAVLIPLLMIACSSWLAACSDSEIADPIDQSPPPRMTETEVMIEMVEAYEDMNYQGYTEILDPVQTASSLGQRYFRRVTEDDDLLGAFVTIVIADRVDRGRITSINPPAVVLDDDPGRTYRIDRQGRALLFAE